jgi:hypothetical protein
MKTLLLFLAAVTQETPTSPPEKKLAPMEQVLSSPTSRSTVVMQAKARADDIVKAYDLFKRDKPTFRISVHTYSGQILSNILDITALPNGTFLLIKLSAQQGTKMQLVPVDDFQDLFYAP